MNLFCKIKHFYQVYQKTSINSMTVSFFSFKAINTVSNNKKLFIQKGSFKATNTVYNNKKLFKKVKCDKITTCMYFNGQITQISFLCINTGVPQWLSTCTGKQKFFISMIIILHFSWVSMSHQSTWHNYVQLLLIFHIPTL